MPLQVLLPKTRARDSATARLVKPHRERSLPQRLALPLFAAAPLATLAYAPDGVLDALSSARAQTTPHIAYLWVLIAFVVAVLLAAYSRTIYANPTAGGDYEVISTQLGRTWGLFAASALLVDHVLLVVLSVSAAAAYLGALIPVTAKVAPVTALSFLALLSLISLNHTRAAGAKLASKKTVKRAQIFAWPTYFFIAAITLTIVVGAVAYATGSLQVVSASGVGATSSSTPAFLDAFAVAFLLMQAFAPAAVTVTGFDTLAASTPTFARPKSSNASATLRSVGAVTMVFLLALLLLARAIGARAGTISLATPPLIAQVAAGVFGQYSVLFVVVTMATGVLVMFAGHAALTAFQALATVLTREDFVARQLDTRANRVAHPNSILTLTFLAAILILSFDADITRLVHLYVVATFTSITLAQLAMVKYWNTALRTRQSGTQRAQVLRSRAVNIVAFMVSGIALAIILVVNLSRGAWVSLLLALCAFAFQLLIRRHYAKVHAVQLVQDWAQVDWDALVPHSQVRKSGAAQGVKSRALILISAMSMPALQAIRAASALGAARTELVHVVADTREEARIRTQWESAAVPLALTLIAKPHNDVARAFARYIAQCQRQSPGDAITVYIPQFLVRHWWEGALHNQTLRRVQRALADVPNVRVVAVPCAPGLSLSCA